MAAPMKSTKLDKKLKKKQIKFREKLEKVDGITITENPTKVLCVHNGGLDNGVNRDDISSALKIDGSTAEIIMVSRKPYCFVCFTNLDNAVSTVSSMNGIELAANEGRKYSVVLYLSFVNKVPSSLSPCQELPPGLVILENFVSESEEEALVSCLKWKFDNELKHREVKHYGYEFKYGINDVDAEQPLEEGIPQECNKVLQRALKTGHVKYLPDQLTVNKYNPGQGIPPHVDTPAAFEDGLMSLSLLSQVVMEFSHPNGRQLSVLLPRCSLLIMTGESRYLWSHAITPRKSDIISTDNGLDLSTREMRISFTFRKIIPPRDRIGRTVPFQSSDVNVLLPKSDKEAEKLENSHVQQVYEEIADHFSGTRHTPWPRIAQFIKNLPVGSILADIGCGNGKYLGLNKFIFEVGSDRSFNLSDICHQRSHEVYVGDVLNIPIRSASLDVCLCIAVIHHMSTQIRREKAIQELLRVIRPEGKLLIYVWAMEQELQKVKSKYLKDSKLTKHEVSIGDSKGNNSYTYTCKCNRDSNSSTENSVDVCTKTFKETQLQENNEQCGDIVENRVPADKAARNEASCCCLAVHKNRTHFQQQDLLVPWEKKNNDNKTTSFHRYYHVFKKGELEDMCLRLGGCQIIESYYDQGNWAVILEKK